MLRLTGCAVNEKLVIISSHRCTQMSTDAGEVCNSGVPGGLPAIPNRGLALPWRLCALAVRSPPHFRSGVERLTFRCFLP